MFNINKLYEDEISENFMNEKFSIFEKLTTKHYI